MLLLAINVLLLLVGCFLDPLSAILLLSPLLVPMVKAVGINTVHFGIVVTVNLAIGLFHPPFGINIFVAQSVLGLQLETIYRGIIPFVSNLSDRIGVDHVHPGISLIGVKYPCSRMTSATKNFREGLQMNAISRRLIGAALWRAACSPRCL
jgi:C4-dicarboxylate transporter DctM subunit